MLAAVALGIGVLLLIIAFIRSLRRKAPATANWVFSGLFLAVAAVLWIRGSDPAMSNFPAKPEVVTESVIEDDAAPAKQPTESPGKQKNATRTAKTDQQVAETAVGTGVEHEDSKELKSQSPERLKAHQTPQYGIGQQPTLSKRVPNYEAEQSWEDKVFAAIDASFDWIEEFFEQYATPVPATHGLKEKQQIAEQPKLPAIAFPEIRFNSGTAELTSESQVELKILAAELTSKYPKGILEIQAYVDSVGPEAFNFVLTQARADAVRDLLVSEGMNKSRIIAKGYGTGEKPELADSRIEFVVIR